MDARTRSSASCAKSLKPWYFGAPDALANAFARPNLRALAGKARFRDPDAVVQPARALAELVEEFQKVSGARRMAQELTRENRSRSFQVLIAGIDGLAAEDPARGHPTRLARSQLIGSSGAAPNQPESVLFRVSVVPAPSASSTPGSPARSVDDAALAAYLSG